MRVAINLASRPYVELGQLYKRLRILIAALVLLAVPLWLLLRVETQRASAALARLQAAQRNVQALDHEQQSYQADMRQPQNAAVLRQSQFLNEVFARKAFSWTAVMMDLENVLPSGVQVLNIDPVIAKNGDVTIRLRVSGERDRAVDLVRNLEHSRRFLSPRLASESAETNAQGGRGFEQVSAGGVNFDVLAEYNPLPESPTPAAKSAGAGGEKAPAAKQAAKRPRAKKTIRPSPANPSSPLSHMRGAR
jgi:type IV pilus assembly protein PilN